MKLNTTNYCTKSSLLPVAAGVRPAAAKYSGLWNLLRCLRWQGCGARVWVGGGCLAAVRHGVIARNWLSLDSQPPPASPA